MLFVGAIGCDRRKLAMWDKEIYLIRSLMVKNPDHKGTLHIQLDLRVVKCVHTVTQCVTPCWTFIANTDIG